MMLFRKKNRISPHQSNQSSPDSSPRGPIKDSYLGRTYYFCLPGEAETLLKEIGKISAQMNTERLLIKQNREDIERTQMAIFLLSQDAYYADSPSMIRTNNQNMKLLTTELERLQDIRDNLMRNLKHYIPISAFANTETESIEIALKQYPAHALSLFKIVVPDNMRDFEHATLPGKAESIEVVRFDLLKYMSSIKSLTFTKMHRSSFDNADIRKKPERDLQALIDSATEYQKTNISSPVYGNMNQKSGLKTIIETDPLNSRKDLVVTVRLDEKNTIGFIKHEKTEPPVQDYTQAATRPRTR